jgi:uncharacterized protein (DUF1499 family)
MTEQTVNVILTDDSGPSELVFQANDDRVTNEQLQEVFQSYNDDLEFYLQQEYDRDDVDTWYIGTVTVDSSGNILDSSVKSEIVS